ncbi:MAG: PKD domain-containing protein, partial [Crocinitomicaceae bacterium]|nr:PKD domain-containing protein [Crocinitomicaceae bacterium]
VNQSALIYSNYVVANDLVFCEGDSVLLYGSQMADTYQWSGGSTAATDSVYATTGGAYTLAITDACGTGSETITLTMNDVPVPSFTSTLSYLTATFTNTSATGPNPTYLWDFGDGNTSTMANPGNIYNVSGPYTVTLTITNDCGSSTFTDSILLTVAGIDELLVNGDVNVFPNPSNGEFTVDMELISNSNVSFRVENLVGAIVYETKSIIVDGAHSETISIGNVPTGVYFVNIQVGENNLVKKLIIE